MTRFLWQSLEMHENALQMIWFLWQSHRLCMKVPCGWHDSCDRVTGYAWKHLVDDMIPVTESWESNIMWIKIYWLPTHTLWWSTMFMCSKKFFGTLYPLTSNQLYNLMAAGNPLVCLTASILVAQAIIRLCSIGSPIGETGSIKYQSSYKRDMSLYIPSFLIWWSGSTTMMKIFIVKCDCIWWVSQEHWFVSAFSSRIPWHLR